MQMPMLGEVPAAERLVITAQARGVVPEAVILRPRGLIGVGDPSLVPRLLRVYERIGDTDQYRPISLDIAGV